jgi:hypothetical protein
MRRHLTEKQAVTLMGKLVTMTTGWNDDAVDVMVDQMMRQWHDDAAASEAVDAVLASWTQTSRPPWGVLAAAYRDAVRRSAMAPRSLPAASEGSFVTIEQGRQIAAHAYAKECARRNPLTDVHTLSGYRSAEPNFKILDGMLKLLGDK